nr:anthocyanidin-3-glucoside rhamnosyltransferase 1 [Aglaonema commutatum]
MGRDSGSGAGDGRLHVAMFPFLAFGHIVPFAQLSKKLAAQGARVSFLSAPANIPRIASLLSPSPVDVLALELPHVEGLPPEVQSTAEATPATAELLTKAVDLTRPQIQSLLAELRPHAIFHDFAQPWLPSVAHPLGIKTVFFSVFAAVSSAFLTVPSRRPYPGVSPSVEELRSPPPGFPSPPLSCIDAVPLYQAADFAYIFRSFDGRPCVFDRVVSCMSASSAIAIKTCREMEAPYIDYVEAQYGKPVLLAGPVVPEALEGELEAKWASWLDSFPAGSVVFCSFGSETVLTDEGVRELALGLELTGRPFFLVLNFPKGGGASENAAETLRKKLPEGFEEKVRGKGMVHSGWVQQRHILAHPSVGCFLCHAGLSSVVEGLISGCQLVMLPQRGDQFVNARIFAGDLRAGVEVRRRDEDGGFTRVDVKAAVRMVMAGEGEQEVPLRTVRESNRRWQEFLLDPEVHRRFTAAFVDKLKEMSGCR